MKKLGIVGIVAMAFALVAALSQCKKDHLVVPTGEKVFITLNVSSGASTGLAIGSAKVDVNTENGVVTFENGDVLYVVSNGVFVGTMTYNGSIFSGVIIEPTEEQPLHFYYMGNVDPTEALEEGISTECSVVISDQTEHLPVISYAPSRENYEAGKTSYNATLMNKCALVKFNVTTASVSATCLLDMNNKVTVNFETNEFSYGQKNAGNIALAAGNGEKWAILLPQEGVLGVETHSYDGDYYGTSGAIPAINENDYLETGIEVIVSSVHETVNLGLPSGRQWATSTIAINDFSRDDNNFLVYWAGTNPNDYSCAPDLGDPHGLRFLPPYYLDYNWTEFTYEVGYTGWGWDTIWTMTPHYGPSGFTKYCNDSEKGINGFTDNRTMLESGDDAATSRWGLAWRTPTKEEWEELFNHTSHTWTTQNGVEGMLFTGTNGFSVFLPKIGYGSFWYWSSSLNTNDCSEAYGIYFWGYYGTWNTNIKVVSRFNKGGVCAVYEGI